MLMEENEFSDEEVKKMLLEVLKERREEKRKYPNRVQLTKAMCSVIGEFLSCYKIIGFDYEGQPIDLMITQNPKDKSAMDAAFLESFSKHMARRSMGS